MPKGLTGMPSTDSGDTSVVVDSWSPAVQCYGICLDINWDNFVNEADFLTVVGEVGHTATDELACMDGVFSSDGVVDSLDIVSWDWALNSEERLLNFCGVPLTGGDSVGMMSAAVAHLEGPAARLSAAEPPGELSDLLIVGKKNAMDAASKLRDRLYVFDSDGLYGGSFEPASDRCNIRLLQGPDGEIYQLNAETGLLRLDSTNEVILPPGKIELTDVREPRYDRSATVYASCWAKETPPTKSLNSMTMLRCQMIINTEIVCEKLSSTVPATCMSSMYTLSTRAIFSGDTIQTGPSSA
jgi:hypothetical protein